MFGTNGLGEAFLSVSTAGLRQQLQDKVTNQAICHPLHRSPHHGSDSRGLRRGSGIRSLKYLWRFLVAALFKPLFLSLLTQGCCTVAIQPRPLLGVCSKCKISDLSQTKSPQG